MWALGLLLALARRRMRWLGLLLLAGLATASARAAEPIHATLVDPFARLVDERTLAEGDYLAPLLSPDGRRIVMSGPGFGTLWVLADPPTGEPRLLTGRTRAGYRPVWTADSRGIGLRSPAQPFDGQPLEHRDLEGRFRGPLRLHPVWTVFQRADRIVLRSASSEREISPSRQRCFAPQLAGDARHVVFACLESGLWLHRLRDGATIQLGPGSLPEFSGDGRLLAFVRSRDDGARLVAADLWICDTSRPGYPTAAVTSSPARLELYPSLDQRGEKMCYSADGDVICAELRLVD